MKRTPMLMTLGAALVVATFEARSGSGFTPPVSEARSRAAAPASRNAVLRFATAIRGSI